MASERIALPKPLMRGSTTNPSMGHLVHEFEREDQDARFAMWAGTDAGYERVLGHFIPPFQRPAVWTRDQNVAFVENAWRGIHLGTYVVNKSPDYDTAAGRFHSLDRWLIDGQQRLRAVFAYLSDGFPVFGRTWSELTPSERHRFEDLEFARTVISETDEATLRHLYDCLNFSGTAHAEGQRATARPTAEPGLTKSYSGMAGEHAVDLSENEDGSWSVSFAANGAWTGEGDVNVTVATESDALAAFRALRDRNVLPSLPLRDGADMETDHAP